MKKFLLFLCVTTIFLGIVGSAKATTYTSTFDLTEGYFSLTGFSDTTNNPPTATNGPDTLTIDEPTGSYTLEIPPPGTYDWFIELNSLTLDLYGDSTPEIILGHHGPYFIGTYDAPTPGLSGSYSFGNVYIPSYTYYGHTYGGYTLNNLSVNWNITLSGTDITQIVLTLSADNLELLNEDITYADNNYGGGNGVIDGYATANFEITASSVPEPATILLMGIGFLGMAAFSRRPSIKKG